MTSGQWPSVDLQRRAVGTAFLLTPAGLLLTLGVLASAESAESTTIGTPVWHVAWLASLGSRAALLAGLAVFANRPHRGKRGSLARLATGLAVLALSVGLTGYGVALYGPRLALVPGSEHAIVAGEQGVLDSIVSALSGGLTLAGHLLIGAAVIALALAAATAVARTWYVLLGVGLGLALVAVSTTGLTVIDRGGVLLSETLVLVAYLWVAGLGVSVLGLGSDRSGPFTRSGNDLDRR